MRKRTFSFFLTRTFVPFMMREQTFLFEVRVMTYYRFFKKYVDGSVAILMLSALLFSWTYFMEDDDVQGREEQFFMTSKWTVSEGESLWMIASSAAEEMEMTIEEALVWIKNENELDNEAIYPGQSLAIPVEMKGVASE
ncbi:LysM peptidoglycan-binding domain-containing protein [Salipaludibacillus agaradhaerens]|nr:LysM peptidoglycan-binding domain-containing protein [Salipaludibacillus agaradhaerens]